MNKTNKINKEKSMKLKSILMLSMVAILAMAGGAMAATTTTTSASLDLDGTLFGKSVNLGPNVTCPAGPNVGLINTCTVNAGTFAADQGAGGSGTGFGLGSVPTQVSYAGTQYTGGADSTTGYALDQLLFGMCGDNGCSTFVPSGAVTLLDSQGGATIPVGTDFFNQGTFTTALVSGFEEGPLDFGNRLSQQMNHTASPADADYIDQRLAMFEYADNLNPAAGFQVMNQATVAGGGLSIAVDLGLVDATWTGNIDPFGGPDYFNTGSVAQAVGDNQAGQQSAGLDIGSYGQLFNNSVSVTDGNTPPVAPGLPASSYDPATQALVP